MQEKGKQNRLDGLSAAVKKSHNFILENRSKLILSGVIDVGSFNETEVVVYTSLGELRLKGKELQMNKVNVESGDMEITGRIEAAAYSDNIGRVPNNFITKLFK
ncbi:MAG: sporulation protein YabP [Oscillospiraceae bacterium]|nr:sporulation protein YabP [Oscillospiraceae bacterium]